MDHEAMSAGYSVEDVLPAQRALREAAGLKPELFPIRAVVGMMSDEIEALRQLGRTDDDIAALISGHSTIHITGAQITQNYAPPEARHPSAE